MMRFACPCGYREEADRTPLCRDCKEDMEPYGAPVVAPNFRTIGQLVEPMVINIERRRRK